MLFILGEEDKEKEAYCEARGSFVKNIYQITSVLFEEHFYLAPPVIIIKEEDFQFNRLVKIYLKKS